MKRILKSLDWFWIALGIITFSFAMKLAFSEEALFAQMFFLVSLGIIGKGFNKVTSKKIHFYSKIVYIIVFLTFTINWFINASGG
jgi:hypothetical protein